MTYRNVFEEKEEFLIRHDVGVTRFLYQEIDDKGEFIDQDGNIQAQLYEANRSKEWFVVAGMFMGEVILKTIPYYRLVKPKGAHIIRTKKYIDNPK